MNIGLTYDHKDEYKALGFNEEQIAEFDSEETIGAIERTLISLVYEVSRIGSIKTLAHQLSSGKRWDLVFNIAEGMFGMAREAQVPALLEAFEQPYSFSAPEVMVVTLDKSLAKLKVAQAQIATASWHVAHTVDDLRNIKLAYPLFVKPIAEGTGKGISAKSLVQNSAELNKSVAELLEKFKQPVLIENYLSGREFTVGIVGNGKDAKVVGVMEIIALAGAEAGGHTYSNKENCETLMEYTIPSDDVAKAAEELALKVWSALDCLDAGRIDIRCDDNQIPHFLEVNPLPGLHPTHSDLPILAKKNGIDFESLVGLIMQAVIKRIKS